MLFATGDDSEDSDEDNMSAPMAVGLPRIGGLILRDISMQESNDDSSMRGGAPS